MNEPPSEFDYRVTERLAIMCGAGEPTKRQVEIAREEAFAAIEELEKGSTAINFPFVIEIKDAVIDEVSEFLKKHNIAKRGRFDGTPQKQLYGIIGEKLAVEHITGLPYAYNKISAINGDGGFDFQFAGRRIDVKTVARKVPTRRDFVNNVAATQIKYAADTFVFCSLNTTDKQLEICGWISKDDFMMQAEFFPKGSTRIRSDKSKLEITEDNYEIRNDQLNTGPLVPAAPDDVPCP